MCCTHINVYCIHHQNFNMLALTMSPKCLQSLLDSAIRGLDLISWSLACKRISQKVQTNQLLGEYSTQFHIAKSSYHHFCD